MDIVLLVGSLALILVGAELFTNGIEWFGHKLNLAEGAVGSVLAAVATAMPETLIPVIASLERKSRPFLNEEMDEYFGSISDHLPHSRLNFCFGPMGAETLNEFAHAGHIAVGPRT